MVVPYVKPIERTTDSKVQELDAQMTAILSNPKFSINEKVTMYNQLLAKFQTFFDPATYGDSPQLTNIANTLSNVADKQSIEKLAERVADKASISKMADNVSAAIAENNDTKTIKAEFNELKDHILNLLYSNISAKKESESFEYDDEIPTKSKYQTSITPSVDKYLDLARRSVSSNLTPMLPNTPILRKIVTPVLPLPTKTAETDKKNKKSVNKKKKETKNIDPNQTNIVTDKRISQPVKRFTGSGIWLTRKFFMNGRG